MHQHIPAIKITFFSIYVYKYYLFIEDVNFNSILLLNFITCFLPTNTSQLSIANRNNTH